MTTVREAVGTLLGVCDGAQERDGQGFNGFDSPRARSMYARNPWTAFVEQAAHLMLAKYKGQLSGHDIKYKSLRFETDYDGTKIDRVPERRDVPATKVHPSADRPSDVKRATKNKVVIKDGVFRLTSDFSFKDTAKALIGAKWNPDEKAWDYPVNPITSGKFIEWAAEKVVVIGPKALAKATEIVKEYQENPLKAKAKYGLFPLVWHTKEGFYLRGPYSCLDIAKSIPQARWNKETRLWNYPAILPCAEKLLQLHADGEVYFKKKSRSFARDIIDEHDEQTRMVDSLKDGELVKMDVPLKGQLMDHQYRAFNIATSLDGAGLFMEQGTGKTLAAICVAGHRYLAGDIKRLLVFCPLSVAGSWEAELEKFADFPVKVFNLAVVKGEKRKALAAEAAAYRGKELTVMILNYESSWHTKKRKLIVHPYVKNFKPQMVVCDESQKIKNHTSKQSRAIHRLGDKTKYKMLLTGTPVTQSPLDFYSQFLFLNPKIFGKSFRAFRDEYARMGGFMNYEIIGFKNLGQLAHKAHSICYRVSKKECLDLPDEMDQEIVVELTPDAKKYYGQMVKDSLIMLTETEHVSAPLAITQMMRLQQITGGMFPLFDVQTGEKVGQKWIGSAKSAALEELLETSPSDKKFVIFARFTPEIKEIERIAAKLKRKVVVLDGRYKGNRQDLVRQFQDDDKTTLFIAQISTGGMGLTLTAADTVVFYSTTFGYADYEQARARVHRIGQTKKVTYIHLVTRGTIDEDVLEVLRTKGDISELVVDVLKKGARYMKIDGNTKDLQVRMKELKVRIDKEGKKKTREEDLPVVDEPVVATEKKKKKKLRAASDDTGVKKKSTIRESHSSDEIVSLKDLAEELEVETKEIRKKLRKLREFDKSGGRWEWASDDPQLGKIRAMWGKKGKK